MKKKNARPDEAYSAGPFRLARFGKTVVMDSAHITDEQHAEYRQSLFDAAPKLKDDVTQKTIELRALLSQLDITDVLSPLATIVYVGMWNERNPQATKAPEKSESHPPFSFPHLEYLLNIALSIKQADKVRLATPEDTENIKRLVQEIFSSVMWFYVSTTGKNAREDPRQEARFHALSTRLLVRADSYESFLFSTAQELFDPFDSLLRQQLGADAKTLIVALKEIHEQVQSNIRASLGRTKELLEALRTDYLSHLDNELLDPALSIETFRARPDVVTRSNELQEHMRSIGGKAVYQIQYSEKTPAAILEQLCSRFGENDAFAQPAGYAYWPLNDSCLYSRPIIKDSDAYYCYLPSALAWHLREIIEAAIHDGSESEWKRYQKHRKAHYEEKAISYIAKLAGSTISHRNLFYPDAKGNRTELDGLVLLDEHLFLIEVKAGRFSASAKRGSIDRLRGDLEDLIQEPFQQARRARGFLESCPTAEFCDERGNTVLRLSKGKDYNKVLCVTVTAECLGGFSTYLKMTRALGVLPQDDEPWAVYIHDLRVISELLDSPSEFIHFLQQRLRANAFPQLHLIDEIDFLGIYFKQGLYLDGWGLKENDHLTFNGYTDDIDRFYLEREEDGPPQKPKQPLPPALRRIISELDKARLPGFTRAVHHLLSLSSEARRGMAAQLARCVDSSKSKNRPVDCTFTFDEARRGTTLVAVPSGSVPDLPSLRNYARLKKYQMKYVEWLVLIVLPDASIHFEIIDGPWIFDSKLDQGVKQYAQLRISQSLDQGKIGRNDKCPCHSGKKYKKCCGAETA